MKAKKRRISDYERAARASAKAAEEQQKVNLMYGLPVRLNRKQRRAAIADADKKS